MDIFSHDLIELDIKKRYLFKNIIKVEFYNRSDHKLVDRVPNGIDIDSIGFSKKSRTIKRTLLYKKHNKLIIKPHSGKLLPGRDYIIKIINKYENPVYISTITILKEKSSPKTQILNKTHLLISKTDKCSFKTVQSCLNYVMRYKLSNVVVFIKPGFYYEPLYAESIRNLKFIGIKGEIDIVFDNYELLNHSPELRSLFLIIGCHNLKIENLNFYNTHIRSGYKDQAETIYFKSPTGKHKLKIKQSNFKSEQDTLFLQGKTAVLNSKIYGNVDFIWGSPIYSIFYNSEIVTIGDSKYRFDNGKSYGNGGYIVQSRCLNRYNLGFIFLKCLITHQKGSTGIKVAKGTTYLARTTRRIEYYQYVTYLFCSIKEHISPKKWKQNSKKDPKIKFTIM